MDMRRFAIIVTAIALLFSTCVSEIYAAAPENGTSTQKKVIFYLKPDISVELNEVRQVFKDANGQAVYPIIYNGTAYLPVRAVSALMKEPVEWDGGSKTVYIGKTLTYPVKSEAPIPSDAAAPAEESDLEAASEMQPTLVTGYSKFDVLVMYDFEIQTFKDANGITVYPLNYNGSTYLPIRAISGLMDEPITWDGTAKKISIGDGEEEEPVVEEPEEDDPAVNEDSAMEQITDIYNSEEALYYEASAKISNIKEASAEQKQAIAASASDNYLKAQSLTIDVKEIDQTDFTEKQQKAYDKLLAFAESNEYYILVLENIAYLAASDSDYSMLADTFLYFALDAQTKMEDARKLIIEDEPVY
jgi:hypothetical protein